MESPTQEIKEQKSPFTAEEQSLKFPEQVNAESLQLIFGSLTR